MSRMSRISITAKRSFDVTTSKKVPGVGWHRRFRKWQVVVRGGNMTHCLGMFRSHDDAVAELNGFRAWYGGPLHQFADPRSIGAAVRAYRNRTR